MSNGIASTQNPFPNYGGFSKPVDNMQLITPVLAPVSSFPLTLTVQDVGKLVVLPDPGAGNNVINLPLAPQCPGGKIKLVAGATMASAGRYDVTRGGTTDTITGNIIANAARVACAAKTVVRFNGGGAATRGDFMELTSDGTSWLIQAVGDGAGSISAP